MRILHIVPAYHPEGPGGIEVYSRYVAALQAAAGHDVHVLAGSAEPWPRCGIEDERVDGLPVHRLHRDDLYFVHHAKSYHPDVERLVAELIGRVRPDVVHVHQWLRLTANLVEIADRAGVPAVVTLHDYYVSCPRCYRMDRDERACLRHLSVESCAPCVPRWGHESEAEVAESILLFADQYRAELALARAVLASTDRTADLVAELAALDRARIERLPLAHPPWNGFPEGTYEPPAPGAPFRFGHWGRIAPHKGVLVLLDALRLAVQRLARPVELHVLGAIDAEHEPAVRARAAGLPVRWCGAFEPPALAAAGLHAGVFPSLCIETHGFALDECFRLGLPSIVSDLGAPAERVGDAGLVVPHDDVGALADALVALAAEPERGRALAERIPRLPTPAEHVAALERVYERALAAPAPQPREPHPSALRRASFLNLQRESAHGRLCPPGGPS